MQKMCILIVFMMMSGLNVIGQIRYLDSIFSEVNVKTVLYDIQPNFQGNSTNLNADIYSPVGDTASNRVAIIHMHGGAFVSGSRDMLNTPYMCEKFAKKGYVIASIDYRIGRTDGTNHSLGQAQLRASQDLNSFIRFTKANAQFYNIDTANIFVQGCSAGGGLALAHAFLDDHEFPSYIDTTGIGSLSGIGNSNGHSKSIKAIFNCWGSILDTTWISEGDIPVGTLQSIFDPCIHWTNGPDCHLHGYYHFGSKSIYDRAQNLDIYTALKGFDSNIHGLGIDSIPFTDTLVHTISSFYFNVLQGYHLGKKSYYPDENFIHYYPNPVSDLLHIILPKSRYSSRIAIYNQKGKLIESMRTNSEKLTINVRNYEAGLYIATIHTNSQNYSFSFIKVSS